MPVSANDENFTLVEPRLVKVRAGERGAGWAVGTRGVLTARHVILPFLNKTVGYCLAVPNPQPGAREFPCTVAWEDQSRDLALLAVNDQDLQDWAAAVGAGTGPALAEPGTKTLPVEVVGYPNATLKDGFPHPLQAPGDLEPTGGAISGQMPLDVGGTSEDASALWKGMSGAVVRRRDDGRIVGVILDADEKHQQRRLYARPLPNPAHDPIYAAALRAVGAVPVLQAANAPTVQRLLAVWDETGRPCQVGQVTQLDLLGVRKARTDLDNHGDPYYPYVRRQADDNFSAALDRRIDGTDKRLLLLVGASMSGKSRMAAEAILTNPALSTRPLLVPNRDADLRAVTRLCPAGGAVLWLDDLNKFTARLDAGLVRYLQTVPDLVVVATLRSDLLGDFLEDSSMRPTWDVVHDNALVQQFEMPEVWTEKDQSLLATGDPAIRNRVATGSSLAEVLGAAELLYSRLEQANPIIRQAVAFAVIDWARMGLTEGIPEELTEELWPHYLSKKDHRILDNQDPIERHESYEKASQWLRAPILGTGTMLIIRRNGRLFTDDYLIAHPLRKEIPTEIWEAAQNEVSADKSPAARYEFACMAYDAGVYEVAIKAYRAVLDSEDVRLRAAAEFMLGLLLADHGDVAEAVTAFTRAIDAGKKGTTNDLPPGFSYTAVRGAWELGDLLAAHGRLAEARTAYRAAVRENLDAEIISALKLGTALMEHGEVPAARSVFQRAIAFQTTYWPNWTHLDWFQLDPRADIHAAISIGDANVAAWARFNLALWLEHRGELTRARSAYQRVFESLDPDFGPAAAFSLGELLEKNGEGPEAQAAYQAAIDSRHTHWAEEAAFALAALLGKQGEIARAANVYQALVDRHDDWKSQEAAARLGHLLADNGDLENARIAYQTAIESDNPSAPYWAIELGQLLADHGDVENARIAYQTAIDSSDTPCAPQAAFDLGNLLAEHGELDNASTAYQTAIDSHDTVWAPSAAIQLGDLLAEHGEFDKASTAYQTAIDSHDDWKSPHAAVQLGHLLADHGDLEIARTTYQTVIDSHDSEWGPIAAINLGDFLAEHGEFDDARTAYQTAIDSHHPDWAPEAAFKLGLLLSHHGEVHNARTAYQTAIDSHHTNWAPAAEMLMGEYCSGGDLLDRNRHRTAAASSGNPGIQLSIATLYLSEGDFATAQRLLDEAVKAGSGVAADCLELVDKNGGSSSDDESLRAVRALAEAGDTDSMNMLGVNAAAQGNIGTACTWWAKAAAAGDVIAPVLLLRHAAPSSDLD